MSVRIPYTRQKFIKGAWALLLACCFEFTAAANEAIDQGGSLQKETQRLARNQVSAVLEKHCRDACTLLDVRVETEEDGVVSDDLGFEGVVGDETAASASVSRISLVIQADDRVSSQSRDRLQVIVQNAIQSLTPTVEVVWRAITLPQIGQSGAKEEEIKRRVEERVTSAIERVIETYCPEQCVLSSVSVDGRLVTLDEASALPAEQVIKDPREQTNLRIDTVDVEVSMDADIPVEDRNKIAGVMRAKTRFVAPVHLAVSSVDFPESFASLKEKEKEKARRIEKEKDEERIREREKLTAEANDPYGLEKLRRTLQLFRELAGTKEIITTNNTTTQTSSSDKSTSSSKETNASSTKESALQKSEAELKSSNNNSDSGWEKIALIGGGLLLLAGLIFAVIIRVAAAGRDARIMMEAVNHGKSSGSSSGESAMGDGSTSVKLDGRGLSPEQRREIAIRLRNDQLRDELVKVFFEAPRVAKETFSRLLQEEGVEETARYIHIFGQVVIFELLGDPNLQRDLNDLSEFYHNSEFSFTPEEEEKLLLALKTRVTANEIRVMARKQMDKFDFLAKLDANQIYNLIADEKTQVQSIVLTQLDNKRRRAVFDMYAGQLKIDLMRELCRAEAIPKEYLSNVAKILSKKVAGRPEFDTQNLRASEILIELLEKAPLAEQKALMQNLVESNPEGARGIKVRLVTIEILPYLKDGHLLELVLGMERSEVVSFLAGTREHIRSLILSKAPEELAESWIEELSNVKRIDEQNYRLVEMKVLNRVRYLASEGLINLLDINEMIFATNTTSRQTLDQEDTGIDPDSAMVA